VLVVEAGKIIEDDSPDKLMHVPDSRYRAMRESEAAVRAGFMSSEVWRRLRLDRGALIEIAQASEAAGRSSLVSKPDTPAIAMRRGGPGRR
jgi:hypothetical protein